MRTLAFRLLFGLPVMIVLGWTGEARAQAHAWGVGIGVGYGYSPYWGPGWGWGFFPTHYHGFYGNGLSMYGPPVPTYRPIPGVFGGGDSQFFDIPPLFPGWGFAHFHGANAMVVPGEPAPFLDQPAPIQVEVRLPRDDARVFVDGTESRTAGAIRHFATRELATAQAQTYVIRAEWKADGLTTTHTKKVTGRAGEKVVVDFTR
jgi:uncharacterized protein (TIGR03000 family)